MHVYDRLVAAGRAVGLRHAGLKALASLRMEKGYRDYGHDIDNTDTVLEAGLGFAVALDKPGGFIGRDAVLAQKARGPLTPAAGAGAGDRSRAADVPRRGRPPRRQAGRLHPLRVLRVHPRRRGRTGDDRRRTSPSTRPGWTPASGRSRSGTRSTRPPCPCARCTTRGTSASKCRPATMRRSPTRRATGQVNSASLLISGPARTPLPRRPPPGICRVERGPLRLCLPPGSAKDEPEVGRIGSHSAE